MKAKRKNLLICFTGIDGTGKTTLAKWTCEFLAQKGINCRYVWGSYETWLTLPFVAFGHRLLIRKKDRSSYTEYHGTITKTLSHPFLSSSYRYLTLTEYFFQVLFKVTIPGILHRHIIADRYVYDTMVNMGVNLGYSQSKLETAIRRFLKLCPKPDITIHLDAPPVVVVQRKGDIPSLEYEEKRRLFYLKLAEESDFVNLDATLPLAELKEQLGRHLEQLLREGGLQ